MLKKLLLGLGVLGLFAVSATTSWAQCGQSVGSVGTYQRFSYAPMATAGSIAPVMATPIYHSNVVQVPMAQSYRRFSYHPSASAQVSRPSNKAQWEYSKADPRRYNH